MLPGSKGPVTTSGGKTTLSAEQEFVDVLRPSGSNDREAELARRLNESLDESLLSREGVVNPVVQTLPRVPDREDCSTTVTTVRGLGRPLGDRIQ